MTKQGGAFRHGEAPKITGNGNVRIWFVACILFVLRAFSDKP